MSDELVGWALFNGPADEGQRWLLTELCKRADGMHEPMSFDRPKFFKEIAGDYKQCQRGFDELVRRGYVYVFERATSKSPNVLMIKKPDDQVLLKPNHSVQKFEAGGRPILYSLFSIENRNSRARSREAQPKVEPFSKDGEPPWNPNNVKHIHEIRDMLERKRGLKERP